MKKILLMIVLMGFTIGGYAQSSIECVCKGKSAHKVVTRHKVVAAHKVATTHHIVATHGKAVPVTTAMMQPAKNDEAARCPIELTIVDEKMFTGDYPAITTNNNDQNKAPQRESDRRFKHFPVNQPVSDIPSTDPDYYLHLKDDGLCRFHCSLPY